ncbi:integrase [Bdellovibrio sp. ZAP7]|uniref:tyrosine-type recombinase/integrase n=1 Tax=Bdellovibrio sp. ZAP7 TaxID=2231053 RepID=UPI001157383C|nr:tyrosine-type recombinase/integrase [Bdellovibrio sp. ZAP7]QDK44620.1 integrase [Bdellovibrio sp. ZAP7]
MKQVTESIRERSLLRADRISSLIEQFITAHDVKDISREGYKRRLKDFRQWLLNTDFKSLNRRDLIEYKRSLRSRKFSSNTQAAYMVAVRTFFAWLESEKIYPNLAKNIKSAKRDKRFRKDPLTIPQIFRLLNSIDRSTIKGKRDYALLNLMIRTGPRSIEIARADIDDLRQEAGQPVLWLQGKGSDSKDAYVVLTETALTPILEYLAERPVAKATEPLFGSTSDGNRHQRLSTRSIRRIAKDRLRAISIDNPRISTHSFRHTATTLALVAGASLQETQLFARHSSPAVTAGYAHNIERASGIPEKKIDELLKSSRSKAD